MLYNLNQYFYQPYVIYLIYNYLIKQQSANFEISNNLVIIKKRRNINIT